MNWKLEFQNHLVLQEKKVEELRLNLQIQANKNFLKFFVTKTKVITADKKKIDIRQLGLFKNYRENRIQGD